MKSTGIVRKVDELGRVVIPKEIRKTFFIDEGTPLEIYSGDEGEIVFKKYSLLKNINQFANEIVESINMFTKGKVAIFDKEEVVASSGINVKSAINFFNEHKIDKLHSGIITEINGNKCYIEPIIVEGVSIGGILVWNIEEFSDEIVGSIKIMGIYLGRLLG